MGARVLSLVRAGYATALLTRPDAVVAAYGGPVPDRGARVVARVLGVRHLLQAAAVAAWPTGAALRAGAVVDLLHAASGLALAGAAPAHRRAALVDTGVATLFAVAGTGAARRSG